MKSILCFFSHKFVRAFGDLNVVIHRVDGSTAVTPFFDVEYKKCSRCGFVDADLDFVFKKEITTTYEQEIQAKKTEKS